MDPVNSGLLDTDVIQILNTAYCPKEWQRLFFIQKDGFWLWALLPGICGTVLEIN
jgi:hypothetical protein